MLCATIILCFITPLFNIALNCLVKKLDKRLRKNERVGGFAAKNKVLSSPSLIETPADAPEWTVQSMVSI